MGQSLECMHVLYIISEFQFQHFPIPPNPSPIISLMAVIKALLRLRCTKKSGPRSQASPIFTFCSSLPFPCIIVNANGRRKRGRPGNEARPGASFCLTPLCQLQCQ